MESQNDLILCESEMVIIVQHYLDSVLMKVPVKVLSVERITAVSGSQFRIKLDFSKPEETNHT